MYLCTCVREEGGDGEVVCSETPSLCTCVIEEGGDGEDPCSETSSLLSYTLRYVSFGEVAASGFIIKSIKRELKRAVVYYESMNRNLR
jgi:hypothetical protein